jgi:titin
MRARWVWVVAPIAVLLLLLAAVEIDRSVEAQPPDSGALKSVQGASSPIVVSGMSTGDTYTCAVAATNDAGTSGDSEPSEPFVFKTKPGPPNPVSAVPWQSGVARVIWTVPADNGGTSITGYVVKPFRGSNGEPAISYDSTATAQLVEGLPVGRTYQFQVFAKNALGQSEPSQKTAPITIGSPGQPQNAKAARVSSGTLRVTFSAPANNGAGITSYTSRCDSSDGGASGTQTKVLTPQDSTPQVTVSGLTAGKTYTCVVKATNSRGTGPISSPTLAVKA